MTTSTVVIEKQDNIAWLTLNRIEKHNAFDDLMIELLIEKLKQLKSCQATRVIVLNANGKHFSAGADLNWMKRMKDYSEIENQNDALALAKLMDIIYQHPKPVIASMQGSAFGGGVGLIAACDLAICEQNSKFCFSEVKLGLIPAVISPYIIKAIGERVTKKLFLSGEIFNAQQALDYQLVDSICETDQLKTATLKLATQIANNGPQALIACKKLINEVSPLQIDNNLQNLTANYIAKCRTSDEGQEGLEAFFEKRPPQWRT